MTFFRTIAASCLALLCLAATSCLDGREEVWINADGSGRAHFTYDIPATAARLQGGIAGVETLIDSLLGDFPGSSREVTENGDRLTVDVKLPFSSPGEIKKLGDSVENASAPKSFEHLAGIFDVKMGFPSVDFTRTISPGKALPSAFIPASEIKGRKLTYILHLPVVPTESTATRAENGGRTQIWEMSLATAMRKPLVIHFKADIPIPGWVYASAVGVILLGGAGIYRSLRRHKTEVVDPRHVAR